MTTRSSSSPESEGEQQRVWKTPWACRLGLHSYSGGIAPPTQYSVEVECEKCGKRKVLSLWSGRERDGGPR